MLKSEIKEKRLQMLQYWYVKSKAFEVFMNIKYKIWRHEYLLKSLWNRIVKKYKCKNWFKKANFTNPDVSISPSNPKRYPRHKSYQQKESNSLWRIFWWSKKLNWGHRTFCHNNTPNMARSSLSNKELHQMLLKMPQHKIQFQFRYSPTVWMLNSYNNKKRFIKSEMYVTVGSSRSTVWMVLMKLNCVNQEKCQPQV